MDSNYCNLGTISIPYYSGSLAISDSTRAPRERVAPTHAYEPPLGDPGPDCRFCHSPQDEHTTIKSVAKCAACKTTANLLSVPAHLTGTGQREVLCAECGGVCGYCGLTTGVKADCCRRCDRDV